MSRYILKRLLLIIPVLLGVAILIFTLMYLTPGDPIRMMLTGASEAQVQEMRDAYGLNDSFIVQLGRFLKGTFLEMDMGISYFSGLPVFKELMTRLPHTVVLALSCMIAQLLIGIPLGVSAAVHQNKWQDNIVMTLAMLGVSVPEFCFAQLLILIFSLSLGWLTSYGVAHWYDYILPIISAAVPTLGGVARVTRSQMLEVIRSDYCTTARMKGIKERTILYKHALPNALIPVITNIGMSFGKALGGTVVIETVFSIPGIGYYLVSGIGNRDYPVVRGSVLMLAVLFSIVMLVMDVIYAFIDPRIKAMYEGQQKKRLKKS